MPDEVTYTKHIKQREKGVDSVQKLILVSFRD